MMRKMRGRLLHCSLLFVFLLPISLMARPFVLVLSQDDLGDYSSQSESEDPQHETTDSQDWEDFVDSGSSLDNKMDPGSWRHIFEPDKTSNDFNSGDHPLYYSGLQKIISASSSADIRGMEEAVLDIEEVAHAGYAPAQSLLAFLYHMGQVKERNGAKAFLYHHFASVAGCLQSKLALAYTYYRQDMHEQAVKLYSELAELSINSFLISKDPPGIEPLRIHTGAEENKDYLRKFRGEEGEEFQILEYQAEKGNSGAMHKIGILYYFGLSGLRCDHVKALSWFLKASEKGNPGSMELLGEMFARGAGVQRNYTKAFEWFSLASKHHLYSAYNGMGYLHVKGYGVEKNYTKAKEYFEKAAESEDPGGNYNLGVMHMKGIGVKKDVKLALKYFIMAANAGQPKAFYQLAKMFHTGVGLKKNLQMAISLYKLVAERGPWSFLARWALESYIEGDVGKALLLYSRMAEMGYEVAQSNAAWILDKYQQSMCIGESGLCTESERHQRAHSLWWKASEQGNEHAALLIGDTYYYGRGTEKDYERAAEAYLHAKSQSNAQAIFNLGYMHEHGQGLPFDVHLAKRYYDQALQIDPDAKLPVMLALYSLWIRKNYANGFLVAVIDMMPHVYPKIQEWIDDVLLEEGNATIVTLFLCLATILFLRERHRRHAAAAAVVAPN